MKVLRETDPLVELLRSEVGLCRPEAIGMCRAKMVLLEEVIQDATVTVYCHSTILGINTLIRQFNLSVAFSRSV